MSSGPANPCLSRLRRRLRVRGLVQGVGFRPHVFLIARQYSLGGWVRNDAAGVLIEVESHALQSLDDFQRALVDAAPPLSRVDSVEVSEVPAEGVSEFGITASDDTTAGKVSTSIIPDAAVCKDCLRELFDTGDRHHLYPFLNCTHCGPRYTITRRLPYDRPQTSMAPFTMCADCAREYHDPLDRRFHAQPVACPACGPKLSLPTDEIVRRLMSGQIVAIKGLGGFHLATRVDREDTLQTLRQRKQRDMKPFAVMALNTASLERFVHLSPDAVKLLTSPTAPIVLLPKKDPCPIAPSVAPDLSTLGVMLPYTPLHYLLFWEAAGRPAGHDWLSKPLETAFVMTSANPGGEPLVIDNDEAHARLSSLADTIVTHSREILLRADDSVIALTSPRPVLIRRARGYTPRAIRLPREVPPILALGADLKNTICLTRGSEAFVSQHIGDMDTSASLDFLQETIAHLTSILEITPKAVACDLHPEFLTTRHAASFGLPVIAVQHHHAHIAAIAAEHGHDAPLLGLALDGFGLGTDGTLWGGELLHVDGPKMTRLGHLRPLTQPGGDKAAHEPWRMAVALLHAANLTSEAHRLFGSRPAFAAVLAQLDHPSPRASTRSTSLGRIFDGVAALLGVHTDHQFEGQAAMKLESLCRAPRPHPEGFHISEQMTLDLLPLLPALLNTTPSDAADLFHGTLIAALTEWLERASRQTGLTTVALGGGCVLNGRLLTGLLASTERLGLTLLIPRELPPGDGAISLGQAWIGASHLF